MEENKLITALKVSGLRTSLWNMYNILYEFGSKDVCNNLEREIKSAMHAIDELKSKCDLYLDDYVKNHNKE